MTTPVARWWGGLSEPAKFRFYSRLTLQGGVVIAVVALAVSGHGPWSVAGVVVCGIAAVAAIERRPELTNRMPRDADRSTRRLAAAVSIAVWSAAAIVVQVAGDDAAVQEARVAGTCAAMVASLAFVAYDERRWLWLTVISVASAVVFGSSPSGALVLGVVLFGVGAIFIGTTLLTLWALRLVEDLDHARDVEADLQVAQERLRFARDLHDVVGRGFSAVAVKSELAATLSRTGNHDRAGSEMDEVKALAIESMEQMRALVREYRDIDLENEVAGARALLDAVGCRLAVEGDPAVVPRRFHEVAAWVTREGVTNVVRHASATSATLTLGASGMSLRNDGLHGEPRAYSGLHGLAERLAEAGGSLGTRTSGDEFVLEIRWGTT